MDAVSLEGRMRPGMLPFTFFKPKHYPKRNVSLAPGSSSPRSRSRLQPAVLSGRRRQVPSQSRKLRRRPKQRRKNRQKRRDLPSADVLEGPNGLEFLGVGCCIPGPTKFHKSLHQRKCSVYWWTLGSMGTNNNTSQVLCSTALQLSTLSGHRQILLDVNLTADMGNQQKEQSQHLDWL